VNPRSSHLIGLDFVRGVAALTVLVYHVDFMLGLRGSLLPGGYISVDLFFILSGLVIARTYEDAFVSGRISVLEFARRRLARLYPLYLATTLVGIVVMAARFRSNFGFIDTFPLVVSALANVVGLPTPVAPYDDALKALFPFNAASWSISYELLVNLIYCTVAFRLPTRWLVLIWFCLLGLMVIVARQFGGVDVGWDQANLAAGIARACFSFTSGVLIWRFLKHRKPSGSFALLGVLLAAELLSTQAQHWAPANLKPWTDLFLVVIFLPAIVIVAAGVDPRGAAGALSRFLGDVSYSVYLTQSPLIIAAAGLTQALLRAKIFDLAPLSGILFVPVCVAVSYFVFRYIEMPARRTLRSMRFPLGFKPSAGHGRQNARGLNRLAVADKTRCAGQSDSVHPIAFAKRLAPRYRGDP